jgi:hypothetical protein
MARRFGRLRNLLANLTRSAERRQAERREEKLDQLHKQAVDSEIKRRKRADRKRERLREGAYEAQLEKERLGRVAENQRLRTERREREDKAARAREARELELQERAERTATHPSVINDRWHRWFRNYAFAQMSEQDEYSARSGGLQRHSQHITKDVLENIDDNASELGWNTDDLEMLFRSGFTTKGPDHRRGMARALYFAYLEELGYGRDDFNWWLWREEMGYPHGDRISA